MSSEQNPCGSSSVTQPPLCWLGAVPTAQQAGASQQGISATGTTVPSTMHGMHGMNQSALALSGVQDYTHLWQSMMPHHLGPWSYPVAQYFSLMQQQSVSSGGSPQIRDELKLLKPKELLAKPLASPGIAGSQPMTPWDSTGFLFGSSRDTYEKGFHAFSPYSSRTNTPILSPASSTSLLAGLEAAIAPFTDSTSVSSSIGMDLTVTKSTVSKAEERKEDVKKGSIPVGIAVARQRNQDKDGGTQAFNQPKVSSTSSPQTSNNNSSNNNNTAVQQHTATANSTAVAPVVWPSYPSPLPYPYPYAMPPTPMFMMSSAQRSLYPGFHGPMTAPLHPSFYPAASTPAHPFAMPHLTVRTATPVSTSHASTSPNKPKSDTCSPKSPLDKAREKLMEIEGPRKREFKDVLKSDCGKKIGDSLTSEGSAAEGMQATQIGFEGGHAKIQEVGQVKLQEVDEKTLTERKLSCNERLVEKASDCHESQWVHKTNGSYKQLDMCSKVDSPASDSSQMCAMIKEETMPPGLSAEKPSGKHPDGTPKEKKVLGKQKNAGVIRPAKKNEAITCGLGLEVDEQLEEFIVEYDHKKFDLARGNSDLAGLENRLKARCQLVQKNIIRHINRISSFSTKPTKTNPRKTKRRPKLSLKRDGGFSVTDQSIMKESLTDSCGPAPSKKLKLESSDEERHSRNQQAVVSVPPKEQLSEKQKPFDKEKLVDAEKPLEKEKSKSNEKPSGFAVRSSSHPSLKMKAAAKMKSRAALKIITDVQPLKEESPKEESPKEAGPEVSRLPACRRLSEGELMTREDLVLTSIDGLFYESRIRAIAPPDIYSVIIDGERHCKPRIFTQEDLLNNAYTNITPSQLSHLNLRSRVCAYWSELIGCLYPGTVTAIYPSGSSLGHPLIDIEFDDGDSGKFPLYQIRLLPREYPRSKYDSSAVIPVGRRRSSSVNQMPALRPAQEGGTTLKIVTNTNASRFPGEASALASSSDEEDHVPLHNLALLSPGLEWQWEGESTAVMARGKGRKELYQCIVRGNERIKVGDCALFQSKGNNHLPYIGKVLGMWQGWGGKMSVSVKWFYHPEEVNAKVDLPVQSGALFESEHVDENSVQTIRHSCEVVQYAEFVRRRLHKEKKDVRVYYLAGSYDAGKSRIKALYV